MCEYRGVRAPLFTKPNVNITMKRINIFENSIVDLANARDFCISISVVNVF